MNTLFFASIVLSTCFLPLFSAEPSPAAMIGAASKIQQLHRAKEAQPFWDEKLQRYNLTCPAHFDALKVFLQERKMKAGTVFILRNKIPLSEGKNSHFSLVGTQIKIEAPASLKGYSKYTLFPGAAAATSSHFIVSPVEGHPTVELKLGETCTFEVV